MSTEIEPLDPADEATVVAVQALRAAAEAVDIPDFPEPCPHALRGELALPVRYKRRERFVARVGGEVAGYLTLELPLRDNLDNADVTLTVHPAHRRRGVGRALHAYLLDTLRAHGRSRYTAETVAALPGGPARDGAGSAFATAMGAKPVLEDVRSRLDLATVDEPALAAMAEHARANAAGYALVTWRGRSPDEFAADVGYLSSRLVTDAPQGDLAWDAPSVDAQRVRVAEDDRASCGWRDYSAGAVHEQSGRMVALTQLGRQRSSPWHAFQWITLVDPPHRGHRLGVLVKLGNLRAVREQEPELRMIDTWNAAVNRHMISINEAMGFRPVDAGITWQQDVSAAGDAGG